MAGVAAITGAASGIGRAIASDLAARGFTVMLLDMNGEQAEVAAAELTGKGHAAHALAVDVTDAKAVAAVASRIANGAGKATVVVNCAGWSVIEPFVKNDSAFWQKAIDVNLLGTIAVSRAFLDGMIASGGGSIVNVASDAGRVGSTGEVVYSAAKGGVISFTKALAREMARHSIRVNCVCPGPTATPMLLVQDQQRIDALTKAIPMRRLAEPTDIAKAVSFFASDDSTYITGQVLSVSGGLTMAG
jgi:2-hydroxycyclohexanecarboxyl-CoA dehydrogenase